MRNVPAAGACPSHEHQSTPRATRAGFFVLDAVVADLAA